jgi:hypothetical protein
VYPTSGSTTVVEPCGRLIYYDHNVANVRRHCFGLHGGRRFRSLGDEWVNKKASPRVFLGGSYRHIPTRVYMNIKSFGPIRFLPKHVGAVAIFEGREQQVKEKNDDEARPSRVLYHKIC